MFTNNLREIFEEELALQIEQCETMFVDTNTQVNSIGDEVGMIPIVLEGSIKVFRPDSKGLEVPIYFINPNQSCVISFNSIYNNLKTTAIARTVKPTKIVVVTPEKSNLWFDKYKSWRDFVLKMYSSRLNELVEQLGITSNQKNKIEIQQNKITESIRYAKRIQNAVFPDENFFSNLGCEHFIFFKPRDIVSGDFYWMSKDENGKIIIAVADATGHGVPGAFMSMLGIAFLNEIKDIISNTEHSPAYFLDKLRNKVKESLKQTGKNDEAKDGMDIAFCVVDMKNNVLQFSGAHNPLYFIKNNSNQIDELKADRQPIGIHLKEKPFTNQEIKIEKGDVFYLFSDGFNDQFGGEKGGKYKSKRFKSFLFSIRNENLENQKLLIENEFNKWKGDIEQIDDVLVMGIKI
jgi:serine phosphatase RsbU (regulator of sigma subunit)